MRRYTKIEELGIKCMFGFNYKKIKEFYALSENIQAKVLEEYFRVVSELEIKEEGHEKE